MFLVYVITVLAVILGINYYLVRKNIEYSKHFPGPAAFPIIGCFYLYFNKKPEDIVPFVIRLREKYGTLFRVWVGTKMAFFCTNAEDTEFVLSSQKLIKKNELYKFLEPWLGSGLLLSTGQKWFNKRKIITPAFHFKILEQFVEVFDRQSSVLIEQLSGHADGKLINIYPFITRLTLDVLCETAMGTQINAQTNADSTYAKAVAELSYIISGRFVKIWQRIDFLFNLTSAKKRQDEAIKVLHDFTTDIIINRRQSLIDSTDDKVDILDDVGTKRKMAFLDVLLQSSIDGKPLSDNEIQEEVDTFMFEGHDTTTIAISFTLFLLAKHPEVQTRVLKEIQEVIGNSPDSSINYRNLQDLKYLELVIKESMRLYPPVPIIGRRFQDDLKFNGKSFPGQSNFNIGIFVLHKDPQLFPDPEKFMPERFSMENALENSNPFAYIPFSAGPRNCIGQKFAMLELKSTISKVIRNYELTTAGPDPKLVVQLTLKPQNGTVSIGFKKRN